MGFTQTLPIGVPTATSCTSSRRSYKQPFKCRPASFGGLRGLRNTPSALCLTPDPSFKQVAARALQHGGTGNKQTTKALNIVFVSAEVAPWSKTGGLGDVVGGLPIELAKRGHTVMTVAPRSVPLETAKI